MLTREIPMLTTRAALQPQSFNDDNKTCDLVWSTGAQVRRFDWCEGPFIEELDLSPEAVDMTRLNSGAPLLDTHDCYELESVIGVVERAWLENGIGHATVRFSEREEVEPIVRDVKAGIIRNVSVGYAVQQYEITAPQDGSMPVYRATKWEPYELSLVPIGADAKAAVRSHEARHPVVITQRSTAMTDTVETPPVNEPVIPAEPAAPAAEPETIDAADVATRAVQAERERVFAIRDAVRLAKLDDGIADEMIRSGKSLDQCRDDIWRRWADRVDATATHPNHSEPAYDKRSAEIAQSLLKQVSGVK